MLLYIQTAFVPFFFLKRVQAQQEHSVEFQFFADT